MRFIAPVEAKSKDRSNPETVTAGSDLAATPRTPARWNTAAHVLFVVLALLALAYLGRAVVVPVLLASLLAIALNAPMRWLRSVHIPTPIAAAVVVGLLIAGVPSASVRARLGRREAG